MSKHVIGKEAENTQCLGNVFLSLLFSFVHFLSTLYGFLPFPILGAMNQNPSYISTIKLMAESLLRNFFLHILLTRKDRAGWGERCYVISGKCLKLQIDPEERGRIRGEVGISTGLPSLREVTRGSGLHKPPPQSCTITRSKNCILHQFTNPRQPLLNAMHSDVSYSFPFFNGGGDSIDVFYNPLMSFATPRFERH